MDLNGSLNVGKSTANHELTYGITAHKLVPFQMYP
jgi:hypothetical protein